MTRMRRSGWRFRKDIIVKFKLSTANSYYSDPKRRAQLTALGFEFEKSKSHHWKGGLFIAGDPTIEIATIEELIQFIRSVGDPVIVTESTIEIYDGARD